MDSLELLSAYRSALRTVAADPGESDPLLVIRVDADRWMAPTYADVLHQVHELLDRSLKAVASGLDRPSRDPRFLIRRVQLGSPLEIVGSFFDWSAIAPSLTATAVTAAVGVTVKYVLKRRSLLRALDAGQTSESVQRVEETKLEVKDLVRIVRAIDKLTSNPGIRSVTIQQGSFTLNLQYNSKDEGSGDG
ncbi:MAG: hypothetical protein ACOY93_19215 [Bacillota bacterium]